MEKIIKMNILAILLIIWGIAVSAADSMLEGWWFVLDVFLCTTPFVVIAWLYKRGWLDDIDVDE